MKLKNAMLGIVGGLFTLSVATISCSDDGGGGTAAPTINASGGVSTTTAAVGDNITINGTGLTGATVKINGTTATIVSNTGTTLVVTVASGTTNGPLVITTSGGTVTGPTITIGASITSDSVATDNLLAKWTFDADSKEFGSGQGAALAVGVDYASAGKIGNCANFTNGYLIYTPIASINRDTALQSYTISMWVNIPAGNTGILRSLFQVNPTTYPDIWGAASLSLNNNGAGTDTLPLRADQVQVAGRGPVQGTRSSNFGGGAGKWSFVSVTYDGNGANQTMKLFADGNMIDSGQLATVDKPETFRIVPGGGPAFVGTPANYVAIGTLSFKDRGNVLGDGYGNSAPNAVDRPWASGSITGKIDDIRLFNRALSNLEILALYTIGSTGK